MSSTLHASENSSQQLVNSIVQEAVKAIGAAERMGDATGLARARDGLKQRLNSLPAELQRSVGAAMAVELKQVKQRRVAQSMQQADTADQVQLWVSASETVSSALCEEAVAAEQRLWGEGAVNGIPPPPPAAAPISVVSTAVEAHAHMESHTLDQRAVDQQPAEHHQVDHQMMPPLHSTVCARGPSTTPLQSLQSPVSDCGASFAVPSSAASDCGASSAVPSRAASDCGARGSWVCSACTFVNENEPEPLCRMCGNPMQPSAAATEKCLSMQPAAPAEQGQSRCLMAD